jgi:hypothetical protein
MRRVVIGEILEAVSEPWRHFFSIEADAQRGERFVSLRVGIQRASTGTEVFSVFSAPVR